MFNPYEPESDEERESNEREGDGRGRPRTDPDRMTFAPGKSALADALARMQTEGER